MFISKNNPFLAQILNKKNIKEITYVLIAPSGKKVIVTNIEALKHFLENSPKNRQKQIQELLYKSNYSIKEINFFAKNYAESFLINKK